MTKKFTPPKLALTCASTGLPIGYIPPARVFRSYQPHIAFSAFSHEAVRGLADYALNAPDAQDIDRKYAFMGLLYKIPPQTLIIHDLPKPNWDKLEYLLQPQGLRIFASFVEDCINARPTDLELLTPYLISNGYHASNVDLSGFSRMLAQWVGILANAEKIRAAQRAAAPKIELFRKRKPLKNEIYSIFDSRRSSDRQLRIYSTQLAHFYDREDSILWHQFVTQPITFPVKKLEDFLRNIKAWNSGLERVDEHMQLSYSFVTWLEAALEQARLDQLQSFELTRAVSLDETLLLQEEGMDESSARAAVAARTDPAEPTIHQFDSASKYLAALKRYRASKKV